MESNELLDEIIKYLGYSVLQPDRNLKNIEGQVETSKINKACEIKTKSFEKLQDKTLKEEDLRKIVKKALSIDGALTIRCVACDKDEILVNVAEHPQASVELIQEIKEHISTEETGFEDVRMFNLNKIDQILKKKEAQSLKQCEGELGNLSTSKNSKSNGRQ